METILCKVWGTVKLGIKEWLHKEQLCNSEPFFMTNMLVHLINSEQIGSLLPSLIVILKYYKHTVLLYFGVIDE